MDSPSVHIIKSLLKLLEIYPNDISGTHFKMLLVFTYGSSFQKLGEMDAKMIVAKQLHLNLFLAQEEDEQQKTEISQALAHGTGTGTVLSDVSSLTDISRWCSPGEPSSSPNLLSSCDVPLTGPGFGQQLLQPGFGHPQQLFPNMWPYETTYWGSGANNYFPGSIKWKVQNLCA